MGNTQKAQRKDRLSLTMFFSLLIFFSILATMLIVAGVILTLIHGGVLSYVGEARIEVNRILLIMVLASIALGMFLSVLVIRIPLKPVNEAIQALNRLAAGDYKVRVNSGRLISHIPAIAALNDSFNKMAEELENTEMLRSDFINNFSHEFKTPIMSIAGFAALLKRSALDEAQQREYVDVIEEESLRLASMATNVLNLTKIENQTILTGVSRYNLSEQIRSCVLLLEGKWEKKHIEMSLDFDEYEISANAELLKQVWINLIDNAVKFTPDYGLVKISLSPREEVMYISVANTGPSIPPKSLDRIFQKFYQADESHATEGNGIGLAIVKKAVELHGGRVEVVSEENLTTFTVCLPYSAQ